MWAEIKATYPRIGNEEGPSASPADFSPPGGTFVLGFDGDRPVAGGGVKRLEDGAAEIKRMYVVPEARGGGLGRAPPASSATASCASTPGASRHRRCACTSRPVTARSPTTTATRMRASGGRRRS